MCQLIEPYGDGLDAKTNEGTQHKLNLKGSKLEKVEVDVGPTAGLRSMSPDESKEIKNIYIDCKPLTLCLPLVTLWKLKLCSLVALLLLHASNGRVLSAYSFIHLIVIVSQLSSKILLLALFANFYKSLAFFKVSSNNSCWETQLDLLILHI